MARIVAEIIKIITFGLIQRKAEYFEFIAFDDFAEAISSESLRNSVRRTPFTLEVILFFYFYRIYRYNGKYFAIFLLGFVEISSNIQ